MRPTANGERCLSSAEEDDGRLRVRVCAEFREMPGLTLTARQAARLFSIEPVRCARILRSLVERGVLSFDGFMFARADARLPRD